MTATTYLQVHSIILQGWTHLRVMVFLQDYRTSADPRAAETQRARCLAIGLSYCLRLQNYCIFGRLPYAQSYCTPLLTDSGRLYGAEANDCRGAWSEGGGVFLFLLFFLFTLFLCRRRLLLLASPILTCSLIVSFHCLPFCTLPLFLLRHFATSCRTADAVFLRHVRVLTLQPLLLCLLRLLVCRLTLSLTLALSSSR